MKNPEPLEDKTLPVAPLKIVPLVGCESMAESLNAHIKKTRKRMCKNNPQLEMIPGYLSDTYLSYPEINRHGTGEGSIKLSESLRGSDLFILSDITNPTGTYSIFGKTNHMSPDNHFQDIKRLISATNGNTVRINVVMPFLYEGRQHKRTGRESLDCAMMLRELSDYGVSEIITFDAHDPSVQNSIPLRTFDNFMPTYQFVRALFKYVPDFSTDPDELMIISPDEGAMSRAVYLSNMLGVDIGLFYKRRDYSKVVDGRNPIVAHEYLGDHLAGRDCIVIDDMIASGGSMLDLLKQLKARGARRIFICATYGLFTKGLEEFDKYYEAGILTKLITTNLVYQSPELLSRPYYATADMHRYLANIIDTLNRNVSAESIRKTSHKIREILKREIIS